MSNEKNLELQIEQYITSIEKHTENSIFTDVLAQDTSFRKEVDKFYNSSSKSYTSRCGSGRDFYFDLGNKDSHNKGKCPADLVEILNDFSDKPFDKNKLLYDFVREDYISRFGIKNITQNVIFFIGMFGGVIGSGFNHYYLKDSSFNMISDYFVPDIFYLLASSLAFAAGTAGIICSVETKGTDYESTEYVRLYKTALKADDFMNEHYRSHFIKKELSKK